MSVDGDGTWIAVAISDGHGSPDCFRSDRGAHLAVDLATDLGMRLLARAEPGVGPEAFASAVAELAPAIVTTWRAAVERDREADPVTVAELVNAPRGAAAHEADPWRAYGATLLLALLNEHMALFLQLGDGDILFVDAAGKVRAPMPIDGDLVAGETTSLCLPDADRSFRTAVVDLRREPIHFLMLATDGYGNSFEDDSWGATTVGDFGRHLDERGLEWIGAHLEGWLAESAMIAGDDVSLALVVDDRASARR